tara:strand:- start:1071 stop:2246 length:1176 start_codon:yes stop_codon:yes gene_type:complete
MYIINDFLFAIQQDEISMNYEYQKKDELILNPSLKEEVSKIKQEIEKYANKWDEYKKITNKYEYINSSFYLEKLNINSCVCSYKPISRSYFKMIEILTQFKFNLPQVINSFHLAEGPGGFIEALEKFRSCRHDTYTGMTLIQTNDRDIPKWSKIQNYMKQHPNIKLEYGPKKDGNLYYKHNLDYIYENHKNKYDFITADGGFDYSVDFNKQEENSINLIFCEVLYALILQKQGGSFVLKIFDMFHQTTNEILYLLCYFYKQVYVYKPNTSREANSEKYIICKNFTMNNQYNNIILSLCSKFYDLSKQKLYGIFKFNLNSYFLSKIQEINAIYGQQQVENILNTINYIHDNNKTNKERLEKIKLSNIQKCIKWCKDQNQPIYPIILQQINYI